MNFRHSVFHSLLKAVRQIDFGGVYKASIAYASYSKIYTQSLYYIKNTERQGYSLSQEV